MPTRDASCIPPSCIYIRISLGLQPREISLQIALSLSDTTCTFHLKNHWYLQEFVWNSPVQWLVSGPFTGKFHKISDGNVRMMRCHLPQHVWEATSPDDLPTPLAIVARIPVFYFMKLPTGQCKFLDIPGLWWKQFFPLLFWYCISQDKFFIFPGFMESIDQGCFHR